MQDGAEICQVRAAVVKAFARNSRQDYMSAGNYMFWNRRAMHFVETSRLPMQIFLHGDPIW